MNSSEYLYVFGYESVEERNSNRDHGTDFESTGVFRITAEDEAAALKWGFSLSDWYVSQLFGTQECAWSNAGYAAWIEHQPDEARRLFSQEIRPVRVGEYPPFEVIRGIFHD